MMLQRCMNLESRIAQHLIRLPAAKRIKAALQAYSKYFLSVFFATKLMDGVSTKLLLTASVKGA